MATHRNNDLVEEEWWEKFSDIATKQWELTPRHNEIIRKDYLSEMKSFLLVPHGELLEIGCGSGWIGIEVAKAGMRLVGIDTSLSQIMKAKKHAGEARLVNASFTVGTLGALVPTKRFDSILIHAVLHHMSPSEIPEFLEQITSLLKEHGRLYIYEPISRLPSGLLLKIYANIIFLLLWSPFWLLQKFGRYLQIGPKGFSEAVRRGWTGLSPNEAPLEKICLLNAIQKHFSIDQVHYWHAYSLALAMGCSELKPPFSWLAEQLIHFLYWVDQRLMKTSLRDHLIGVWTWVSITAVKL
jgi:2-polyprenyl-3-methyl-5-hydroxy-6-metoxy-1,4-benzoquinol methylase